MKIVIIGGGIAGMTMALLMERNGMEVVVCEKLISNSRIGHAFLMNVDGLSILKNLRNKSTAQLLTNQISLFSLKRPNNEEKIKIQLIDWHCLKRVNLINFLQSSFSDETLKKGRTFSHFIYGNGKAIAAVFENGEIEYGDIFIGADGSNSKVRELIFGATNYSENDVNEIVCTSSFKVDNVRKDALFQKYQSDKKGLAFGFIPVSEGEVVWFIQYDVKLAPRSVENNSESIEAFSREILKDFPAEVTDVLNSSDFNNSYIWKTRDFDLLPSFHSENIVLIGDAAHLALPFTSAGTTNAILDAECLSKSLKEFDSIELSFQNYYAERSEKTGMHIAQGRQIKETFLNPEKHSERGFLIPLISSEKIEKSSLDAHKLKVVYFTDPICSTCWIIQPILRKLKLEYGDTLDIEYRMGGLLPSWINYDKGIIKTPVDAAKHWDEVKSSEGMYLSGDIWRKDPLNSSYPPSIAFKAAQMQNHDKAISFLRRMKELIFIEQQNITRWDVIENAALSCGLDVAVLKNDIKIRGLELFENDLALALKLGVKVFPTFFFYKNEEIVMSLNGKQSYENFVAIINGLIPETNNKTINHHPKHVFSLFNNMSTEEYAFITDTPLSESTSILEQLYKQGHLSKFESTHGIVWMKNLNERI